MPRQMLLPKDVVVDVKPLRNVVADVIATM